MIKKILLAALASLFMTSGMILIYKSFFSVSRVKLKKLELAESTDITLPAYQEALNSIKTLDPREIKEFPSEMLFLLEREHCRVPVIEKSKNPYGWIQGHFFSKDQIDYAALCLTPSKELTIKIAWGKERPCSVTIGYGMIQKYIMSVGEDRFAFSRLILKAPTKRLDYFAYQNEQERPSPEQEGVEDTLLGRGSLIHYCLNGKWIPLQTSVD